MKTFFTVVASLALVLALLSPSFAATGGPDPFGYFWDSSEPYVWTDISDGTLLPVGDEIISGGVSLGFDFEYYGNDFDTVYVASNGHVSFNGRLFTDVVCAPDAADEAFAGLWTDINTASGGAIYYKIIGEAPSRKFIAQYDNVASEADDGDLASFQIVLEEATDDLVIYVRDAFEDASSFLGIRGFLMNHHLYYACGDPAGSGNLAVRFYMGGSTTTTTPPTTTTTTPATTTTTAPTATTTSTGSATTTVSPTTSTTTTTFGGDCDEVVDAFLTQCPDEASDADEFRTMVCVTYEDPECLEWCMEHHDNCPDIYLCYMDSTCFTTDDDVDDDMDDDLDDDVDDDLNDDANDDLDDDDWVMDDDDDDTEQCISCEITAECSEALGTGWVCIDGCCADLNEDAGDGDDDDDAADASGCCG
jgi:hypothetical protein